MQVSDELLVGILGVTIAAIPWAFSIHAKVAVIAEAVRVFPEIVQEIRHKVDCHEQRLVNHEKQIEALQAQTRPGH